MEERGTLGGVCADYMRRRGAYRVRGEATGRIGGSNRPALPRVLPHVDHLIIVTIAMAQK